MHLAELILHSRGDVGVCTYVLLFKQSKGRVWGG